MYPFSYTGLKIIHDQNVQETLERQRPYAKQEKQKQRPLQAFKAFLARFNNQSGRKQERQHSEWPIAHYQSTCTEVCLANSHHQRQE